MHVLSDTWYNPLTWTLAQDYGMASAFLGALGTLILFVNSYSMQPREGAVFGGPIVNDWNKRIDAKNQRRRIGQLVGLGLLFLSFLTSAAATLVE